MIIIYLPIIFYSKIFFFINIIKFHIPIRDYRLPTADLILNMHLLVLSYTLCKTAKNVMSFSFREVSKRYN